MKLKKIKIKKRNKNYKNIRNKVEAMNKTPEPKKTSALIIGIILISALLFLIVGTKIFGKRVYKKKIKKEKEQKEHF